MQYWLVMPAAGVGSRFGAQQPKQYAPLHGRTVLEWSLSLFLADPRCKGISLALAPNDAHWPAVASRIASVLTVHGGPTRSDSVLNALRALESRAGSNEWVLVHDAARPCLQSSELESLLTTLESHAVGGLLATPVADTLKRATDSREVEQTVERNGMWRALTPQMFRYGLLRDALESAARTGRAPTDEAQAVEWAGMRPLLVQGLATNIKITTTDDLVIADALLSARTKGGHERA